MLRVNDSYYDTQADIDAKTDSDTSTNTRNGPGTNYNSYTNTANTSDITEGLGRGT